MKETQAPESQLDVVPATLLERDAAQALVRGAHLPEIGATFPSDYVVALQAAAVIGVAGLEIYESEALLRSVAVGEAHRGRGLGRKLVHDRVASARARGLRAVYLLTTTCAEYFERLGFERVPRASAPAPLQSSEEFASLCPASAVCMKYTLRQANLSPE